MQRPFSATAVKDAIPIIEVYDRVKFNIVIVYQFTKKSLLFTRAHMRRIYSRFLCGQLSPSSTTEVARWATSIVAIGHFQLRTMASETVVPIDWSLPPPFKGQYLLCATCPMQMRPTNVEDHRRELNLVPPTHEASGTYAAALGIISAKHRDNL